MKFRFVQENRGTFRVGKMCEVLEVSRSGYYAWLKHGEAATARRAHTEAMTAYARAVRIIRLPSGFMRLFDASLQQALPAGRKDPAYRPLLAS